MPTNPESAERVTLLCPNLACGRTVTTPASNRGAVVRCVYCDTPFRVPKAAQPEGGAQRQAADTGRGNGP